MLISFFIIVYTYVEMPFNRHRDPYYGPSISLKIATRESPPVKPYSLRQTQLN